MYSRYLLASWRNIKKHKLHATLNILGLSVGIASCLVIFSYVHYERSYDKYHPDAENTYRVALNRVYPTVEKKWAVTAPILGPTAMQEIPEVDSYTRLVWDYYLFAPAGEKMIEQRISFIDSGFFDVFHAPIISGSVEDEFFRSPDDVILTKSAARKYFADQDPVGQLISIKLGWDKRTMTVRAVIEDPKPNSHFSYEVLCSTEIFPIPEMIKKIWGTWAYFTYLKTVPGTEMSTLEAKVNEMAERHMSEGDDGYQEWINSGNRYEYFLQPITDIHLRSNLAEEFEANTSELFVIFFAIVGIFILLMAIVNFVNLATARASYRTLEVGVRKAIGASRVDLIRQFLVESIFISFIALAVALPLTQLALPFFNQTIGKSLSLDMYFSFPGIFFVILSPFIIGLLAGSYPALYLSNFRPASVFQKIASHYGKQRLRHALVLGQFVIAVLLLAATVTVFRQMQFISNKHLGFDKDQIINLDRIPLSDQKIDLFVEQAMQLDGVVDVAVSGFPLEEIRSGETIKRVDADQDWVNMTFHNADDHYLNTMGLTLLAGRNFRQDEVLIEGEIEDFELIMNEAGAKSLGWSPEEAVGQKVITASTGGTATIIGVVADFNYASLHAGVQPFMFSAAAFPPEMRSVNVRFDPRKTRKVNSALEDLWNQLVPDQVFVYEYMDDSMAQFYEAERLTGKLFVTFSGLAILICCLGLFGLMGFVVERRAKEVGIRKVLGARIGQIIVLMSRDYIKLVLIAAVIAVPIAYWGQNQWLEGFAYRVDNSVSVILVSGAVVMGISWLTVAYYAYQSARSNPVNSLRKE